MKTIKNFEKFELIRKFIPSETMKEFISYEEGISEIELKQSVIDDIHKLTTFKDLVKWERREAIIQYIKRKFNITEDDLK